MVSSGLLVGRRHAAQHAERASASGSKLFSDLSSLPSRRAFCLPRPARQIYHVRPPQQHTGFPFWHLKQRWQASLATPSASFPLSCHEVDVQKLRPKAKLALALTLALQVTRCSACPFSVPPTSPYNVRPPRRR